MNFTANIRNAPSHRPPCRRCSFSSSQWCPCISCSAFCAFAALSKASGMFHLAVSASRYNALPLHLLLQRFPRSAPASEPHINPWKCPPPYQMDQSWREQGADHEASRLASHLIRPNYIRDSHPTPHATAFLPRLQTLITPDGMRSPWCVSFTVSPTLRQSMTVDVVGQRLATHTDRCPPCRCLDDQSEFLVSPVASHL